MVWGLRAPQTSPGQNQNQSVSEQEGHHQTEAGSRAVNRYRNEASVGDHCSCGHLDVKMSYVPLREIVDSREKLLKVVDNNCLSEVVVGDETIQ